MITKICTKCGEEKELSEFHRNSYRKDGRRSACIKCTAICGKKYRKNNKEKIVIRRKLYNDSHKEKIKITYAKWYANNREYACEQSRKRRQNNKKRKLETDAGDINVR